MAGEGPLERAGDLPVVLAEGEDPLGERVEGWEVVRGQGFALEDREVQLDLVQPRGVDRVGGISWGFSQRSWIRFYRAPAGV